jgi:phosphate starvation-inducible membrane PsiE
MGFLEFVIMVFITVAIAAVAVYLLGHFLPGHPPIVDTVIWGVAVLIIVVALLNATGILSHDPQIPKVG